MANKINNSAGPRTGIGKQIAFALTLGIFPMAAMTAGALSALAAGISLLVVVSLTVLCASALRKHLHGIAAMAAVLVMAATFTVATSMVIHAFWPQAYQVIGQSVAWVATCLMAFPWAWMAISHPEGEQPEHTAGGVIVGTVAVAIGMTVLGVLREFLTTGTVFEVSVLQLQLLPSLNAVPAGLILLGIILGLCQMGKKNPQDGDDQSAQEVRV